MINIKKQINIIVKKNYNYKVNNIKKKKKIKKIK